LKRNGHLTRASSCHRGRYLRAKGTGRWRIRIRGALPAGRWEIRARARDRAHNRERGRTRRNTKRFRIH
jgi:hypothetical protein